MTDYKPIYTIGYTPEYKWTCDLFRDKTYVLYKNTAPNWFHRKMQELCFGVKWEKWENLKLKSQN
jgi:hypothetical protein